jgi:hypothetical protein
MRPQLWGGLYRTMCGGDGSFLSQDKFKAQWKLAGWRLYLIKLNESYGAS